MSFDREREREEYLFPLARGDRLEVVKTLLVARLPVKRSREFTFARFGSAALSVTCVLPVLHTPFVFS